jgi:hypothetical protein
MVACDTVAQWRGVRLSVCCQAFGLGWKLCMQEASGVRCLGCLTTCDCGKSALFSSSNISWACLARSQQPVSMYIVTIHVV